MVDTVLAEHIALVVADSEGARRLVFSAIDDRRLLIGRSPDCDIPLNTRAASRKHTVLLRQGRSWLVMDLSSTNGTSVRGQRITAPTAVDVGDAIQIGDATITVDGIGPPSTESGAPLLVVDLDQGFACVGAQRLPLSAAELVWFAYLAWNRTRGDGWVDCGRDGHAALRAFATPLLALSWAHELRTQPLADLVRGEDVDDEDLKNLRGKTVQKLKRWCSGENARYEGQLLPERRGRNIGRLPIAAGDVAVVGASAATAW